MWKDCGFEFSMPANLLNCPGGSPGLTLTHLNQSQNCKIWKDLILRHTNELQNVKFNSCDESPGPGLWYEMYNCFSLENCELIYMEPVCRVFFRSTFKFFAYCVLIGFYSNVLRLFRHSLFSHIVCLIGCDWRAILLMKMRYFAWNQRSKVSNELHNWATDCAVGLIKLQLFITLSYMILSYTSLSYLGF